METGLLEVHLTLILENQRQNMISLWEQFCNDDNRLLKIERWLVYHFPDSSANWIIESPCHNVQIIRDGLLLSKCHTVTNYTVFWNRSISNTATRSSFTNQNNYVFPTCE